MSILIGTFKYSYIGSFSKLAQQHNAYWIKACWAAANKQKLDFCQSSLVGSGGAQGAEGAHHSREPEEGLSRLCVKN